ncbi:MAG: hypothetical protein ACTSWG_13900 [Candidatus Helarchaeota archaeon]
MTFFGSILNPPPYLWILKNKLAWGKFKMSDEIRLALEGGIIYKVKLFERKSMNYRKVLNRLSREGDEIVKEFPNAEYNVDHLLKTLLNSV